MRRYPLFFLLPVLFSALVLIWLGCGEQFAPFQSADQSASFEQVPAAKPTGGGKVVSGEILVKFRPSASDVTGEEIRGTGFRVVKVNPGGERAAIARFKDRGDVEYAEVNGIWEAFHTSGETFLPNDTYFNAYQWNMKIIDGPGAWFVTKGNSTGKIAILDTGIKSRQEDLTGKVGVAKNFTTSRSADDLNGHGTHVAGIAAAVTNNQKGVAGIGFNCTLMNGKVLGDDGSGAWSWIANGITWAADNGAKVINMSLGGSSGSATIENAITYAWGKGVVVVAAAGNGGVSTPSYPAYYDNVIAVAATDENDNLASFSNYGAWVDVAAPGTSILSTYIRFKPPYVFMSGTSMAAPHVAGLAGLLAAQGGRANTNIRAAIETTTDKAGTYPITNGRINAHKAVDAL